VREIGLSLIGVGVAVLAIRELAGRSVVDSLAATASVEPAADEAWSIATELLVSQAKALIVYGVIAIVGSFLAGPSRVATDIRRAVAPWADEPGIAYTAFALLMLAILLWVPTELTNNLLSAVIVIGVLALGYEMLRRQIEREWPDAKDPNWGEAVRDVRDAFAGLFGGARDAIAAMGDDDAAGGGDATERRLAQLERLGKLKESGVLTPREFTAEKERILAGASGNGAQPASAKRPAKRSSGQRAASRRK
jgi:hypothetical protein